MNADFDVGIGVTDCWLLLNVFLFATAHFVLRFVGAFGGEKCRVSVYASLDFLVGRDQFALRPKFRGG